ncbi:MAG TPA: Smr/MutS family protein [Sphingomicrobium sp.]|nr:Smr/MutS family protein [Sphingomicrobium sp.]
MRSLSPEEAELWARVTSTIQPLSREKAQPQAAEPLRKTPVRVTAASSKVRRAEPLQPRAADGQTLDGSWDRRLRSGVIEPDRVLDLHGMSLDTAWRAIDRGLEQSIGRGERVVLLITGHHRPGDPPVRRGAIRAAVHNWLAASRHASDIAAVRGAHRRHGGGGSLYVILRRKAVVRR